MLEPSNYSYFPYKPIVAIAKVDASMVIFETSIQRLNDLTSATDVAHFRYW